WKCCTWTKATFKENRRWNTAEMGLVKVIKILGQSNLQHYSGALKEA
ncbi:10261_t:CDS:2, partial [Gigaspora rosea]